MSERLNVSSDYEAEVLLRVKRAGDGVMIPATGLTGVSFVIAATPTGAAIGALTAAATERSGTGRYFAVFDAAAMTSALAATYLGKTVYLVVGKSGDIGGEYREMLVATDHAL
jgi:hypothetical protein